MKIAIISDIHDNQENLRACLDWCRKNDIAQIICCGDMANSETLAELASFSGAIHLVAGNCDLYYGEEVEQYENIKYYGKIGYAEIGGFMAGICHENYLVKKVIEKKPVNIVFFGHTHRPWIKDANNVKTVNPGTLGGWNARPTFAFWDTEKRSLELIRIDELTGNN